MPGPWNERREAVPGVPKASALNSDRLKYNLPFWGFELRFNHAGA